MVGIYSCGIIEIMPRRVEGYNTYRDQILNDTTCFYETVNHEQFIEPLEDSTFIISWAPWCPHSSILLEDLDFYLNEGIESSWVLISTSYDLEAMNKVTKKLPKIRPYCKNIWDGDKYGSVELDRIKSLSSTLLDTTLTYTPIIYFKDKGEYTRVNKDFLYQELD